MSAYERIMAAVNPKGRDGKTLMPTEDQRRVIESDSSSILVVAGAGSGKTRTMANRIAYWVGTGKVKPSEVLGLTFTRKAAGELDARVAKSLSALRRGGILDGELEPGSVEAGRAELEQPTISTYNSFGSEIAQSYGLLVSQDPAARLMTDAERHQLMTEIVDSIPDSLARSFDTSRQSVVSNALAIAARLVDNDVSVREAEEFYAGQAGILEQIRDQAPSRMSWKKLYEDPEEMTAAKKAWNALKGTVASTLAEGPALCQVAGLYLEEKRRRGLVEFSDQIAVAVQVLERISSIRAEIASRYRLVLLDEYQDTSVLQARMLSLALGSASQEWRSVAAVGDPNQAIYGWRGASANAFADFEHDFSELGAPKRCSLATTFRNDVAVLEAANAVAGPIANAGVPVGRLAPRPGAAAGQVLEIRPLRREDSYTAMALRIRDVMDKVRAEEGRPAETAVLCRKRSYIELAAQALGEAGVPYEIVGGQSILERPEVATVRCALEAAQSPDRADALARLCGFLNIGLADLRALKRAARAASRAEISRLPGGRSLDEREEFRMLAALDSLGSQAPEGMSEAGHSRLRWLAGILKDLRGKLGLPLGELVYHAASILGLYLSAVSRTEGARRVATSLDAFSAMADQYARDHAGATLGDFLAWLDAVESHEHGGEGEAGMEEIFGADKAEVNPGVVQIMTVHASKGLEWKDLVAIPELVEGEFSEIEERPKLWPARKEEFPYPLRIDRSYLPRFELKAPRPVEGEPANLEAIDDYAAFTAAELEYESQEARRLAYVAMTRPQRELLVVGYAMKDASTALYRGGKLREEPNLKCRSAFLAGVQARPLQDVAFGDWAARLGQEQARRLCLLCPEELSIAELMGMLDDGELPEEGPEPIPDFEAEPFPSYPADLVRFFGQPQPVEAGVESAAALDLLEAEAALLLAEAAEKSRATAQPRLSRPYLTATDVVSLAADADAFMTDQLRPVPREPSLQARVGTEVHRRIAESYLLAPTLDLDGTDGAVPAGPEENVARLFAAYAESRWARYRPVLVEAPMSVMIGGTVVRCTIDAVLDTSHVPGMKRHTIVDWKTGSVPRTGQLASRELQLALYRLAYAKAYGIALEDIGACFVYLDAKDKIAEIPAGERTEGEIEAMIAAGIDACADKLAQT